MMFRFSLRRFLLVSAVFPFLLWVGYRTEFLDLGYHNSNLDYVVWARVYRLQLEYIRVEERKQSSAWQSFTIASNTWIPSEVDGRYSYYRDDILYHWYYP